PCASRISLRESWGRTCGIRLGTFPASLYVGMTTSARSPMPGAPGEDYGSEQSDEERAEGRDAQGPARLIQLRVERELHHPGPRRERDGDQGIVPPQHLGRPTVRGGLPVGIPVLRDQQVAR